MLNVPILAIDQLYQCFELGGAHESVSQPMWSPMRDRCTLMYLSDGSNGWWNIHKVEINMDNTPVSNTHVLLCDGEYSAC